MFRLIEWENVCLVCLQKGANRYIFEEDNDSNVIADKIMKCSDILIKRDTNQPRNICLKCLNDLNVAYKFRRNCEQSDSVIKAFLNKNHQAFEIKDLWEAFPTTLNSTLNISIKDEVLGNAVVDDTCDNKPPSLDLEYGTKTELIYKKYTNGCVHSNAMEINDEKVNQTDKTTDDMNCKLSKPQRGQPKKLTEICSAKPSLDNVGPNGICKDIPSLDLENRTEHEPKFLQEHADANESNKIEQKLNCKISKRSRGRPKKLISKSYADVGLKSAFKIKLQKICKICGRSFRFKTLLETHMRRHKNERPFSCDSCDKAFVTVPELQCHMRVHTGQKPLKCQYCDRRFSDYSVRRNHESTHTGERPYVCPTCGKSFGYSNGLRKHLRVHSGVKKFECKQCGREFKRKGHFVKHVAHHPGRDELEQSSKHKQKKRPEKEILQIEENANSNEMNIKHESVEIPEAGDICEGENTPCPEFEKGPATKANTVVEDHADASVLNNATVIDNVEVSENNKFHLETNSGIARRARGRPKKSTEVSCERRSLDSTSKNKPLKICKICGHGFRFQNPFDTHMRRHNNERPFRCDRCDKAFVTAPELQCHIRVHTGQKPFKCQYCDCRFSHYTARQNHESKHTGERPYVCPTCGKSFAYSKGLTLHLRIHTGVKKFECQKCGKGFTKKMHFEKHIKKRHPIQDELDKSSEQKQEKESFQVEVRTHSNEINIKCETVDNAVVGNNCEDKNRTCLGLEGNPETKTRNDDIIQQENWKIPKRRSGGPKKTEVSLKGQPQKKEVVLKMCEICNRGFKDQFDLEIHMRRHNNERPFSCDHCDKAFVSRMELLYHVRLQTGQRRLKCRYCDRRFSDYSVRKNHESTHTGERPYVCPTCGKSFAYFKGLTRHLRTHTGVKKFACKECGKEFTRKLLFEKHVSHHLTRDKFDKSSEHKQNVQLKTELFQIEENANSNEINIKHEIVEDDVIGYNYDGENKSCLDLEDDPVTEAKNDEIIQLPNGYISKRHRGRPKKTEASLKICEICFRGFKNQCNLDNHMRRHNNERPFSCDHCGKAFVTSTELQCHVRVHTGQKPLKCQYCDRRFSDYSVRKNHESTHTGERPYVCATCGKSFAYSKGLTRHLRTHPGVNNFMYKECDKRFIRNVLFEKHVARYLTGDELDKSSEHQQMKPPEKEIVQTELCTNSNEINIKREVEPFTEEVN